MPSTRPDITTLIRQLQRSHPGLTIAEQPALPLDEPTATYSRTTISSPHHGPEYILEIRASLSPPVPPAGLSDERCKWRLASQRS